MEAQAKLERLDELYGQVAGKLQELERSQDPSARGVSGTWSVKDVYAHIGRWDQQSRDELEAHVGGTQAQEEPPYRVLNARWLAEDEELSLEEARGRFRDAFRRYRSFLGSLAADQWDDTVHEWIDTTIEHYEDHVRAPLEFEVAPGG
ncbi:MAG: maleylpyruvate isomerase N-terminal domain-containing protein [Chloroflexota bacterium]|nr:maleylpyruvate isomerase N-terminal domain-containing protein [Chloroflexota bacterium]